MMSNKTFKIFSWIVGLLTFGVLIILSAGVVSPLVMPNWVGVNSVIDNNGDIVSPQKTLWDLLELIIIPVVLTVLAVLFDRAENKRNQDLADDRNHEESLQSYLAKVGDLILDKGLLQSEEGVAVRIYARTLTLTTVHRLNPSRKSNVIQFLKESNLIECDKTVISLAGADFREVNIKKFRLKYKNLSNVNFTNAILTEVILCESNLTEANLYATKLEHSDLKRCKMSKANLRSADFTEANLMGAELTKADLREALLFGANLNADLTGARLEGAKYNNATVWPKGFNPESFGAMLVKDTR